MLVFGALNLVLDEQAGLTSFESGVAAQEHRERADTVRLGASVLEIADGSIRVRVDDSGQRISTVRRVTQRRTVDRRAGRSSGWAGTIARQGDIAFVPRLTPNESSIVLVDTTPVDAPRRIGTIPGVEGRVPGGERFVLGEDILVAAGNGAMQAYNVRDTRHPDAIWHRTVNGTIEAVDIEAGEISLVVTSPVADGRVCPLEPIEGVRVMCQELYHSGESTSIERVSTVLRIGEQGEVEGSFSFAGPAVSQSVIEDGAAYITYSRREPVASVLHRFLERLSGTDSGDGTPQVARSSFVPIHGPAHGRSGGGNSTSDVSNRTLERALERISSRMAEKENGVIETRFRDWLEGELRSYVRTGVIKVDATDFTVEARADIPGVVPRRDLLAVEDSGLVIASELRDPFGNGTAVDVHLLDGQLSVRDSLRAVDKGRLLVDSIRVKEERGYMSVIGADTRTHFLRMGPDGIAHDGSIVTGGQGRIESLSDGRAIMVRQQDDTIEATLFDLSGPEVERRDTRTFGSGLLRRIEGRPIVSPPGSDQVIVAGTGQNHVVTGNRSLTVGQVKGSPAIDAVAQGSYLYLTGSEGLSIIGKTGDGSEVVGSVAVAIGYDRPVEEGPSGLLGPPAIGERYIRVLDVDASPATTDFGLAGDDPWHPENRTKIYRTLQDQERAQYLLEVAGSDDAARYPEAEPTDEQLEAAWRLYNRTFENARENGWFNITVGREDGFRDLNNDRHYQKPSYAIDGRVLDPERPEVLMYYFDSETDRMVLVGVMYLTNGVYASSTDIEDGAGPLTYWHYHQYDSLVCYWEGIIPVSDMGLSWSGKRCPHLASTRSPEMMHVWFVDHPDGQFAHRMNLKTDVIAAPEKMTEEAFKTKMKGNTVRE